MKIKIPDRIITVKYNLRSLDSLQELLQQIDNNLNQESLEEINGQLEEFQSYINNASD